MAVIGLAHKLAIAIDANSAAVVLVKNINNSLMAN